MKRFLLVLLLVAVGVIVAGVTAQAAGDHEYVGASKCKMCHKVQYASWEQTTHAKSLDHAKACTDREFSADCLKCHATNASEELPGVQCEACHGPGADYKKMSVMKDREQAVANGLVVPSQATCDTCHTGEDHATKKDFETEKDNVKAIHEHDTKS